MGIVDCRQDTPEPVYLREVPIDLGDEEKERRYEKRECEGRYERISVEVDILKLSKVIV